MVTVLNLRRMIIQNKITTVESVSLTDSLPHSRPHIRRYLAEVNGLPWVPTGVNLWRKGHEAQHTRHHSEQTSVVAGRCWDGRLHI